MPRYLYSARSADGHAVTDFVEGPTVENARYALELRQLTEIVFHTDEGSERVKAWMDKQMGMLDGPRKDPRAHLKSMRSGGLAPIVMGVAKSTFWIWAPLLVWTLWSLWSGPPYSTMASLAFLCSALFAVYLAWLALPGIAYHCAVSASSWNRERGSRWWRRVLLAIERLGGAQLPHLDLDVRLAGVLARNDKVAEGAALVGPYEATAEENPVALSRLAGFWTAAGEFARATRLRERAITATGGQGVLEIIDHAHALVRYQGLADEAEASLARLTGRELGDLSRLFVGYTVALIALERRHFAEAYGQLGEVEQQLRRLLAGPMAAGMTDEVHVFAALALAGLGRMDEARARFGKGRARLLAHADHRLIERCRQALPGV